jgi:hypothetical protein
MHNRGAKDMQWIKRIRWPGISVPDPVFLRYVGLVPTWRLGLATVGGGALVLLLGRVSHSGPVGYGYGGLVFVLLSWPLGRMVVRSWQWTDATVWQASLLVIASLAMGSVGQRLIGFNPQAAGMRHMTWPQGQQLLWQFPLVLPVENLVLLGGLVVAWQIVRPRGALDRLMVALLAAFVFGFWHVPAWGGWTMVVIGLTVLPWVIYIVGTGDMVVPVVAHVVMDTLAVIGTTAPPASLARRFADPIMLLSLLLIGLLWSLFRQWQDRRRWS